jgi:DNA (cytosine-5)-methyltransferase 1
MNLIKVSDKHLTLTEGYNERPLLYDVFCGAGGAAMGYFRAGFRVIGIDNDPKPLRHYPFENICMDALEFLDRYNTGEFERATAFHASPPCHGYSIMNNLPWLRDKVYPKLISPVRAQLKATGKLYVIENVAGSRYRACLPEGLKAGYLCGGMFGLPFYRHRYFESNVFWMQPGHPKHQTIIQSGRNFGDRGHKSKSIGVQGCIGNGAQRPGANIGHCAGAAIARNLMGIDWMNRDEITQALPPIYLEYIGRYLLKAIGGENG